MIDPTEKDRGRKVVYVDKGRGIREDGVLTSWNPSYVFVRFGSDVQSQACRRQDLEWLAGAL